MQATVLATSVLAAGTYLNVAERMDVPLRKLWLRSRDAADTGLSSLL